MTNICSEIVLHTDEQHSFVCCLSSLNLAKYDEWKDTDLVYTSTMFLDGVLEEALLIISTNPKMNKDADFEMSRQMRDMGDRFDYLYPDRRMSFKGMNLFMQTREEIEADFKKAGINRTDIFDNTLEIADKVGEYDLYRNLDLLPVPKTNADEKLRDLAEKGLEGLGKASDEVYMARLEEELQVIKDKSCQSR